MADGGHHAGMTEGEMTEGEMKECTFSIEQKQH